MEDFLNSKQKCHICREELTTIHAEIAPGRYDRCIECDAEGVAEFVAGAKSAYDGGHC